MFIFIAALMLLSMVYFLLQLSRLNIKMLILYAFGLAVILLLFYPLLENISWKALKSLLHDESFVVSCCIYQIFESMLFISLSVLEIKNHFNNTLKKIYSLIRFAPPLIFLTGLLSVELGILYTFNSINYFMLIFMLAVSLVAFLTVSAIILKLIIKSWEAILEIKIMLLFFQFLFAMFIPLMVAKTHIKATNLLVDYQHTILSGLLILFFSGTGFIFYKHGILINKKIKGIINLIIMRKA